MSNSIHDTVVIIGSVEMGTGNEILPYSVLIGPLRLGNNNYIGPHVTIGTPGQDTRNPHYDSKNCPIEIGDNNIIREYTAVQKPCYKDITRLGNGCFLMQSVHVPHDALIDDGVVITPMVVMGGIVRIMAGATLSIGCSVHQYSVIGKYSIAGMGAAVTKNIPPFSRYIPGKPLSVNEYALKKYQLMEHAEEVGAYVREGKLPTSERILSIVEEFEALHRASGRERYK